MKKAKKKPEGPGSTIRLPQIVWDALQADADRCVRSRNGQVEAILKTYYELDNVELGDVSATRSRVSPPLSGKDRWKVPVVEANLNDKDTDKKTDEAREPSKKKHKIR